MSQTSPPAPGGATFHPKTSKNSTPSEAVMDINHGRASPLLPSSAPDVSAVADDDPRDPRPPPAQACPPTSSRRTSDHGNLPKAPAAATHGGYDDYPAERPTVITLADAGGLDVLKAGIASIVEKIAASTDACPPPSSRRKSDHGNLPKAPAAATHGGYDDCPAERPTVTTLADAGSLDVLKAGIASIVEKITASTDANLTRIAAQTEENMKLSLGQIHASRDEAIEQITTRTQTVLRENMEKVRAGVDEATKTLDAAKANANSAATTLEKTIEEAERTTKKLSGIRSNANSVSDRLGNEWKGADGRLTQLLPPPPAGPTKGGNVTKIPPPPPAGPTRGENATKMGGFDTDAAPPSPPANERAERRAALLPTPTDDTSGGVTVAASRGAATGDVEAICRVGDFASTMATTLDDELAAFHEEAESLGGNDGEDGAEDAETSPPNAAAWEEAASAPTDAERTDAPPASDPPRPPRRTTTGGATTECGGVAIQATAPALAPTAAPPAAPVAAPTAAPPTIPTAAPTAAPSAAPTAAPTAALPAARAAAPTAVLSAPPAIPPPPTRTYYSGGVATTTGGFTRASGGVDVPASGFIPVLEGARELPKQSGAKDSGGRSPGPRSTPQSRDSCRPEGRHRKPPDPGPSSRTPFSLLQEKACAGRQHGAAKTIGDEENAMPRRRVEWGLAPSWTYGSDDDDPIQKAASGSHPPPPDLRGSAPMRVLHVRAGLDEYERDPPWEGPSPDVGDGHDVWNDTGGGYDEGYDCGYEPDIVGEEYDDGYFGGCDDGQKDGHEDESIVGYYDGYNESGYDDGYNDGYESEISDDGQSYWSGY